ncbi:MAG: sodium/proline symporter [Oscillospiraceae bacterium]|nr:sodium/proline symporter [Oscillospiraceae bacterium]
MSSQALILIVFVVYFGVIVSVALRFRQSKNLSDYFLAGRNLNKWVGALSAQTSDMSGWLLMGLPGAIYAAGTGRAWIAVGLIAGTVLNWCFVAKKLRRYTIVANNSVTLPEFLENRFQDKSQVLKITSAIFFAVFFTVYAASGFVAGGTLLPQIFGVSYQTSVVIIASFVVLYTLIGGLMAISWTDSIQGMMMLLAVFFLPIIVISQMGGWSEVMAGIPGGYFNMMSDGAGGTIAARSIISDVAWGLGYFGMPHILIKLIAIKKESYVSSSAVIAIVWVLLALGSAVMVGLVGTAFVPGLENSETVFITMVRMIFIDSGNVGAMLLGALFLCGMFAAIKSTADSQLLVGSSAIGDIYKAAKKNATDKNLVWFSRGAVFVVALVALWIAVDAYDPALGGPNRSTGVMVLVAMAWAGFGSAFGPLVLCSLFWKRTNRVGAIAGVATGGLTVIIWTYVPLVQGATLAASTRLYSLVPGFFLSLAAIIIVSLLTAEPSKEILADFETAQKPLND